MYNSTSPTFTLVTLLRTTVLRCRSLHFPATYLYIFLSFQRHYFGLTGDITMSVDSCGEMKAIESTIVPNAASLETNESLQSLYLEFSNISDKITVLQHQRDALHTTAKAEKHQISNVFKKLESQLHSIQTKCLKHYDEIYNTRKNNMNIKLKNLQNYQSSLSKLKVK